MAVQTSEMALTTMGVFRSLLDRLSNDVKERVLEKELKKIAGMKKALPRRGQFTIKTGPLAGKSFVYPTAGEENWGGGSLHPAGPFCSIRNKICALAVQRSMGEADHDVRCKH